jgi:hypothetical protein
MNPPSLLRRFRRALVIPLLVCGTTLRAAEPAAEPAAGDDESEKLAKQLSNPVAALISVPLQSNWDFGAGPTGGGTKYTLNIQPVIPITLSKDWNLISRTILPVIDQHGIVPSFNANGAYVGTGQSGLGDTTQSFFFSPAKPGSLGIIWGVGPVLLLPTATNFYTGAGQWSIGPTFVVLKQTHGFTIGMLANQLNSFARVGNHQGTLSSLFVQPFISYTTKKATSFTLNTETTYDWNAHQATVPLNFMIGQIIKIGKLPVQFTLGGRYYAEKPTNGPDWGMRFVVTFLFPK